jgi:hypothetical protein
MTLVARSAGCPERTSPEQPQPGFRRPGAPHVNPSLGGRCVAGRPIGVWPLFTLKE